MPKPTSRIAVVALVFAIAALVVGPISALMIPGREGPQGVKGETGDQGTQGTQGPTGPAGPAPNVVSMDGLGECFGMGNYSLNIYMLNLGPSARSISYSIRYFRSDGLALVVEIAYGPEDLGPWEFQAHTISQAIFADGCSYPHLVWGTNVQIITWR